MLCWSGIRVSQTWLYKDLGSNPGSANSWTHCINFNLSATFSSRKWRQKVIRCGKHLSWNFVFSFVVVNSEMLFLVICVVAQQKHRAGASIISPSLRPPMLWYGLYQSGWAKLWSSNKHPQSLKLNTTKVYFWMAQISLWTQVTLRSSCLCVGSMPRALVAPPQQCMLPELLPQGRRKLGDSYLDS